MLMFMVVFLFPEILPINFVVDVDVMDLAFKAVFLRLPFFQVFKATGFFHSGQELYCNLIRKDLRYTDMMFSLLLWLQPATLMHYCSLASIRKYMYTFAITIPDFLQNGQTFCHIIDRVCACHIIQHLVKKSLLKKFPLISYTYQISLCSKKAIHSVNFKQLNNHSQL